MTTEMGLWAGLLLDALAGDPRRGHPVAAFGRAASALERRLYRDSVGRGAVFTAVCVAGAAGAGLVVDAVGRRTAGGTALTAAATWAVVGGTSLGREGLAMAAALEAGDVEAARRRLPHLCGRDPSALDAKELARATVESVAENTSDAAVAPLFWGAVLGVPGLLAYRAVNTLDAMVGHRSPRYLRFGRVAARLDDAANWVPARLTGLLTVACAPLVGGSPRDAYAILRRDGAAHPSPNAGRCEAAFAGALGVRLGGVNVYGSRVEHRPELGDGRAAEPQDVRRAVRLSRTVTVTSAAVVIGARAAVRSWWRSRRR
ncbi:cobalamin biosynthesis protein [Actinoallomurus soli]|uniref:cobalamin biosynthesis protein n=1 Tax=Actinoallomurus soli TaxID=2952535 RepID=UPI0027E2BFF3|nr:cobalamin biosynthesis protein [Actinoallomurus soli]